MTYFFPIHQETCSGNHLGHPRPGGPAVGAGPVPPACLDHLLLLHLERGQVHGQGEVGTPSRLSVAPRVLGDTLRVPLERYGKNR